jgi:hypothetical protein
MGFDKDLKLIKRVISEDYEQAKCNYLQ